MYDNIDLGNLTSKEIGNLMTTPLVDRDKELINMLNLNLGVDYGIDQGVDHGDLPSGH